MKRPTERRGDAACAIPRQFDDACFAACRRNRSGEPSFMRARMKHDVEIRQALPMGLPGTADGGRQGCARSHGINQGHLGARQARGKCGDQAADDATPHDEYAVTGTSA